MAIAFGASASSGGAASSQTVALTVAGSQPFVIGGGFLDAGTTLSGVTYAGTSLTQVTGSPFVVDAGNSIYLGYLTNPTAGTNNLVATFGVSGNTSLLGAFYTGVKQTGQPDAAGTSNIGSTSTPSQAITTVADGCFVVWVLRKATGGTVTAGANTTLVTEYAPFGSHLLDNQAHGAVSPAGSFTENATLGGAVACYGIMMSFNPATGVLSGKPFVVNQSINRASTF